MTFGQDLARGTNTARDGSMDGTVVPPDIGSFSRKEERILYWARESFLSAIRSHLPVAVSSARKWIALPIMKIFGL